MLQRIKNTLGIIAVSVIITVIGLNVPSQWVNLSKLFTTPKFGAAFSTLAGSNTVASFPATYNSNLTLTANLSVPNTFSGVLNTFLQSSTTQLSAYSAYFGATATSSFSGSGALTLVTPLLVPSGGTGSTTLSTGQILIGSSAGNIGVVNGYGTNGQFLTSAGTGVAPTWTTSSIDQTLSYNFTGTSFGIKNLVSSSTIQINNGGSGVSYSFPTSNTLGVLGNNGSGTLSWGNAPHYVYASTTVWTTSTNTNATTSPLFSVPSGVITASSTIEVHAQITCASGSSCSLALANSTLASGVIAICPFSPPSAANATGNIDIYISAVNSVSSWVYNCDGVLVNSTTPFVSTLNGGGTSALNLSGLTTFRAGATVINGGNETVTNLQILVSP